MELSYTVTLVRSLIQAAIQEKLAKGFTKLHNGLFRDVAGNTFTVNIAQSTDETGTLTARVVFDKVYLVGGI